MKEQITPAGGPKPMGPYSPGIRAGDFVFVAGQGPLDPETNEIVGTTIQEHTRQTLDNVKAILEAAGATMDDVVKTTVFLSKTDDFGPMREVYRRAFADGYPARSALFAQFLNAGCLVQIEAVAYKPQQP